MLRPLQLPIHLSEVLLQLDPDNGSVIARASFPCAVGLDRENFLMTFMSNMNTLRDQMDELKKFSNK